MNPALTSDFWKLLGFEHVGAYDTFELLTVVLSVPLAFYVARRLGLPLGRFAPWCGLTYLTAVVTSKLVWLLTVPTDGFVAAGIAARGVLGFVTEHFVPPWSGGQVYYGSVLGVLLSAVGLGLLLHRREAWAARWRAIVRFLDVCAFPMFVISAVGRLGCYFAGCCYGQVDSRFGVPFAPISNAAKELARRGLLHQYGPTPPLIPTQLIEVCTSGSILLFLLWRLPKAHERRPGYFIWHALLFHAIARFHIEWLRFDTRGALGPLSTSQWIALAVFLGLVAVRLVLVRGGWRREGESAAVTAEPAPQPETSVPLANKAGTLALVLGCSLVPALFVRWLKTQVLLPGVAPHAARFANALGERNRTGSDARTVRLGRSQCDSENFGRARWDRLADSS